MRQGENHPGLDDFFEKTIPKQPFDVKSEGLPRGFCEGTPTYWLHIPKNGMTFGKSVVACKTVPGEKSIWVRHKPLTSAIPLKYVASFFRQPDQRLASEFAFGRTHFQALKMHGPYGNDTLPTVKKIFEKLQQGRNAQNDDYLGKNFLGCQTNMVLGRGCMQGTPTNASKDAEEASAKVDEFRFVGLVEEWPLSICLFNYLVTGKRFVTYHQLVDSHPTHKAAGRANTQSRTEYDTRGYARDGADEELYAHVAKRFHADLNKHDITIEKCSYTPEGRPFLIA